MNKALTASELRGLSHERSNAEVVELREELFGLRFTVATEQLGSYGRLREIRKDIARVYIMLQERNLDVVNESVTQGK